MHKSVATLTSPVTSQLVGRAPNLVAVLRVATRLATRDVPLWIYGETGTGKECLARMIHEHSLRAAGPFVPINCAAIPDSLFESELFGHVRGAFTGALRSRRGALASASGGTLFLDEIGDMPFHHQAKLLRVLEEGAVTPLGSDVATVIDVRVIAASNQEPRKALSDRNLREDLYYRIAGAELRLPPLRERTGDIARLAKFFVDEHFSHEPGIAPAALQMLEDYEWPGNVRQLRHVMNAAIALAGAESIQPHHLNYHLQSRMPAREEAGALASLRKREAEAIEACIEQAGGNISAAARLLGVHRNTLRNKMRRHGLLR